MKETIKIHRVLLPLDGSEFSELAIPDVVDLAARLGFSINVIHIMPSYGKTATEVFEAYIWRKTEIIRQQVQQLQHDIGIKSQEISISGMVLKGEPTTEILQYSNETATDLIVMSSHGISGYWRGVFGSVTQKILFHSKIPVWVTKDKSNKQLLNKQHKREIVVPLDGSKKAECIIPYVINLIKQKGVKTELVIIGIFELLEKPYTQFQISRSSIQERSKLRDYYESYLFKVVKHIKDKYDIEARIELRTGNPAEEILSYTEKMATYTYLIAMCTHGSGSNYRWAFGSVTSKVLASTTHSTLIYRNIQD